MSAKWIRSKQWDDQNIPPWAWPVKFLLRAFSSITLAVILLSLVVVYAILASVPIGLLALAPTYLLYGLTLVAATAAGLIPVFLLRTLWRPATPGPRAGRFVASFFLGLLLCGASAYLWRLHAWPRLLYDPATHAGLRLFPGFVEAWSATTLRRLPGFEMSELEFYSWWPLRVILLLFVTNMVVATVRRIEFIFPNLGVLTVHTGIVTIALGSVYYKGLKQEGDTLLLAGQLGPDGTPTPGPPQTGFYDNTRVALWTRLGDSRWEQRLIQPPRYNDYNLAAGNGLSTLDVIGRGPPATGRTLDSPVPRPPSSQIDADLTFRVVGYASYADPEPVWVKADPPPAGPRRPVRFAELVAHRADPSNPDRSIVAPFFFIPDAPAQRLGETEVFGLEYIRGMSPQRFADLTADLPADARHALVVDVPARDGRPAFHAVYKAEPGAKIQVGDTGFALEVKDLTPQPPFPIITDGYRGATSSVAVVRVVPPTGESGSTPFTRYLYHRFPEISQDLLDELNERGMPKRRDADPSIRIAYIDASKLQVYLDEPAGFQAVTPPSSSPASPLPIRAIIRQPGSPARVTEIAPGGTANLMASLDLRLTERWDHAEQEERPAVVPERARDRAEIGTHGHAMLAVEVASRKDGWKDVIWLPFTRYLAAGLGTERTLTLPDGRHLSLAFGRVYYPLPGFMILLRDFRMIAYDHRGSPRDYQSLLQVVPAHDAADMPFKPYTHLASLNAPLQAPFHWDDERPWLANAWGTLTSRLSPRQFKFSQAGWDQRGWAETQDLADKGILPRPYVNFTILGVGNNPGIHVVAFGAILMSIGIPWAFYIKPLIMKRRSARLKAQVEAGTYRRSIPPVAGSATILASTPEPIGPST